MRRILCFLGYHVRVWKPTFFGNVRIDYPECKHCGEELWQR